MPVAAPVALRRASDEEGAGAAPPLPWHAAASAATRPPAFGIARSRCGAARAHGRAARRVDARVRALSRRASRRRRPHAAGADAARVLACVQGWLAPGAVAEGAGPVHRPWGEPAPRALAASLGAAGGRPRQGSLIDGQRWLALAFAARLKPEHTQLVVDQALLPHLQGRRARWPPRHGAGQRVADGGDRTPARCGRAALAGRRHAARLSRRPRARARRDRGAGAVPWPWSRRMRTSRATGRDGAASGPCAARLGAACRAGDAC
jgi:hypothetical protein